MATLLKGQDVQLKMTQGGAILKTLLNIKDWTWRFNLETLTEQFLGQTIPYFDDVFDGMSGEFSLATFDNAALVTAAAIVDRAANRTPDQQWNVAFRYAFPDATPYLITIYDLKFKPIEFSSTGRKMRVWTKFQFMASKPPTILAVSP